MPYFTLFLNFTPDESTPSNEFSPIVGGVRSDPSSAPTIFTALEQQLGLKLESIRGPQGYVVIDRAVKPPSQWTCMRLERTPERSTDTRLKCSTAFGAAWHDFHLPANDGNPCWRPVTKIFG